MFDTFLAELRCPCCSIVSSSAAWEWCLNSCWREPDRGCLRSAMTTTSRFRPRRALRPPHVASVRARRRGEPEVHRWTPKAGHGSPQGWSLGVRGQRGAVGRLVGVTFCHPPASGEPGPGLPQPAMTATPRCRSRRARFDHRTSLLCAQDDAASRGPPMDTEGRGMDRLRAGPWAYGGLRGGRRSPRWVIQVTAAPTRLADLCAVHDARGRSVHVHVTCTFADRVRAYAASVGEPLPEHIRLSPRAARSMRVRPESPQRLKHPAQLDGRFTRTSTPRSSCSASNAAWIRLAWPAKSGSNVHAMIPP